MDQTRSAGTKRQIRYSVDIQLTEALDEVAKTHLMMRVHNAIKETIPDVNSGTIVIFRVVH